MDDSRPGVLTRGGRRADAFELPLALRVPRSDAAFEAFGLRARAREAAGGLEVEIDGERGRLVLGAPRSGRDCVQWPFAALRGHAGAREMLFAAPDLPVIALLRDGPGEIAWRLEGPFTVTPVPLGADRSALVVCADGADQIDLQSLVAAAVARARRRAATRPVLSSGAGEVDDFARAEHEFRRELRRAGSHGVVQAGDDRSRACGVLAMYALNDAATADEMVRALDVGADGVVEALVTGASAAWRGVIPESPAIRASAAGWMRRAHELARTVELDAWSGAALALAPAAAELMDDADVGAALRAMKLPAMTAALARLAAEAGGTPAGRVLGLMHATLGVAPDAVRGRVALQPAAGAAHIDAEQIAVGDGLLAFRAEVGPERATYEVEQTSGGTPLTILLEPGVPGRRLMSARVDDTMAELDAAQDGANLRVKVQLVADRPRRLELRYER